MTDGTALAEPAALPSYDLLRDLDELDQRAHAVMAEKLPFGFDVETGYQGDSREGAALHPEENFIAAFQFTNSLSWGRMVPLAFDRGVNVDNARAAALFWQMLHAVDDEGLPLGVPWGAMAELRWLSRFFLRNLWNHPLFGRQVREARGYYPLRSDGLLESFAEGRNKSHGLKNATLANFGHRMRELTDLQAAMLGRPPTEQEKKSIRFNVFSPDDPEVIAYACEDAVWALRHHLERFPRVRGTFIYKLEMQVLPIVCEMADTGVCYDWALLRSKSVEVREFSERLLAEIVEDFEELAGEPLPPSFNFNSNKQLGDLLYVKCKMPVLHRTEAGAPSVDAKNALPGLAARYPVVKKYMGWKRLDKLRTSFLDIYEAKYSWADDGRAHPMLMQYGTIAGRFSCESPNYQQSPGKYHFELRDGTVFHFNFRDALVATRPGARDWWDLVLEEAGCPDIAGPQELGFYIVGFDLSQAELRVMAAEAGETALLEAFAAGEDVHSRTAALMVGVDIGQVTKEDRAVGKTRNFASVYGQGIGALADQLGISLDEAKEKDRQYNAAYPHLQPYRRQVIGRAKRDGYVTTKFGRRVTLWGIRDENPKIRAAEERTAGNAVIQGPATGDYVKMAMVRALKALRRAGLADKVRLIMNIHDALEFEVREDVPPALVISVLQPAVSFPVTGPGAAWPDMVAEWHLGRSWGGVKDVHLEGDQVALGKADKCERCRPAPVPAPAPAPDPAVTARLAEGVTAGSNSVRLLEGFRTVLPAGPPRKVIVTLARTPTREQVSEFGAYLKGWPGANSVELKIPEGAVPVAAPCGLSPAHQARVAVIFGGRASVDYDLDSVDAAALTDGLDV